ncbi:MAG: hypothetical protein ABSD74_06230 [Rhizomicrobium sp.]|jgi:hypothetical protein
MIARRTETVGKDDNPWVTAIDPAAVEGMVRTLAASGVAAECLLIGVTVVALVPMIQMAFGAASTFNASWQQSQSTSKNADIAALAALTESVDKILHSKPHVVVQQQPAAQFTETLAVS